MKVLSVSVINFRFQNELLSAQCTYSKSIQVQYKNNFGELNI